MMRIIKKIIKNFGFLLAGFFILSVAFILVWLSIMELPDFKSFTDRKVVSSTKIYDRTGEILLFDVHKNIKRTTIPFDQMGINIKNATVAIEDSEFYQHKGIRIKSIIRAFWANIVKGGFSQGGSTITQQVLKNTLLSREKTLTRKIKEWILSIKIESSLDKDKILEAYLNEAPYGGVIYGIEEASKTYFNKKSKDLTLSQAAYLASMPKAPTFYSPYGKNSEKLDDRKNTVLSRMKELNFISEEEYTDAFAEKVSFLPEQKINIQSPHFVFYVQDNLKKKYGDQIMEKGWKVYTTLDFDMQKNAEEIVNRLAKENEQKFEGKNAALVAIDPKTGQILTMVGSRDYFEKEIDGSFNTALSLRQPGSSFKPFIYATAFNKGYTPDTILFDVPTEFQSTCDAYGHAKPGYKQADCYMPSNYDNQNRGPMTIRSALAESINVPAVKALYLVGLRDALKTSRDMGINTLNDPDRYGLTLVIGGGEVSLLEITSAYGVFATEGERYNPVSILKIEDELGNIIEEYSPEKRTVLPKNITLMISDILSDNNARIPTFGANSLLNIPGRDVAVKTGTTNNNRDAWTIGYTPSISVGVWVGNNDNTPMKKGGVSLAGPIWNAFISSILQKIPDEKFNKPFINKDLSVNPVLRGIWLGGESYLIDKISGKLATEKTPKETIDEKIITNVHSILYWVDKNNPTIKTGSAPLNDNQFERWEIAIQNWWQQNKYKYPTISSDNIPTNYDDIHTEENIPIFEILEPAENTSFNKDENIVVKINGSSKYDIKKITFLVNDLEIGSIDDFNKIFTYKISDLEKINNENELRVVVQDTVFNKNEKSIMFSINENI